MARGAPHTAEGQHRVSPRRWYRSPGVAAAAVVLALAWQSLTGAAAAAADPEVPPTSTTGSPPRCDIADRPAKFAKTTDWSRTMVDWIYRVPSTYQPPDLVPVSRAGLTGGGSVRAELIPDLKAMASAARAAGSPLAVESAYRSYASQVSTFGYWRARYGYATAILGSARPGHSEHQLGTTLDFKSLGGRVPWAIGGYDWASSRAGRWLLLNAWKYGFVMSYPKNQKSAVCYGYEPWHYRYFGRTVAGAIHASGLPPRVWLWRHGNSPASSPTPTPTPTPPPTPTPTPTATPTETPTPTPAPPAGPSDAPTATPSATEDAAASPSVPDESAPEPPVPPESAAPS